MKYEEFKKSNVKSITSFEEQIIEKYYFIKKQ
jgi:hypothetical protein